VTTADPVTVEFSFADPGSADTHDAECAAGGVIEAVPDVTSPASCTLSLAAGWQTVTVMVTDDDGGSDSEPVAILVTQLAELEIRPNAITLEEDDGEWEVDGPGTLRVYVFSSSGFDATSIIFTSVTLGDPELAGVAQPTKANARDRNRDGVADLVLKFKSRHLLANGAIDTSTVMLELRAQTPNAPVIGWGPFKIRLDD